ncbi:CpsD/CapB family tyrosine-protein kinase [Candidatus Chlorohelix sp.]|uniref:CpsD/CapB family tyrosine-protein kinase n=1 Tax=Candidatus Chlorohelix sp. TaxID=3139201 RepID=UPI003033AA59
MSNSSINGVEKLVTLADPRSPAAEAYKDLRTNIQFSGLDRQLRALLITSARPDEGKSETLANLAVSFAQTGNKVLMIDCDLRRPSLHILFGLEQEPGLSNVILEAGGLGSASKNSAAIKFPIQETGVPNLRLLPAGLQAPNPAEILGSNLMREIIEQLRGEADYLFFDSPPLLAVTDAAVLSTRLDGVLLTLKANKTKRDDAKEAKEQLEKVRANIIGVALNEVKSGATRYSY